MARIPYPDDSIEQSEWIMKLRAERRGHLGNIFTMMAHNPEGAYAISHIGVFLRRGTVLAERLRELAILATATAVGSEYEWSHHVFRAKKIGIAEDLIRAIGQDEPGSIDGLDGVVVRYASQVARTARVDDEVLNRLRAELSDREVMELAMTVGYYSMTARILVPFEVELEEVVTSLKVGEV